MDQAALSFLITQHVMGLLAIGPCTVLVIRTSLVNRILGLSLVIGAVVGSFAVKTLSVLGLAVVLKTFPFLFSILRLFGALYLIYLGLMYARSAFKSVFAASGALSDRCAVQSISTSRSALSLGFFASLTNPLSSIRFIALFSTVITKDTLLVTQISYLIVLAFISFIFYLLVALFFSTSFIQSRLHHYKYTLDAVLGGTLVYWGVRILQLTL